MIESSTTYRLGCDWCGAVIAEASPAWSHPALTQFTLAAGSPGVDTRHLEMHFTRKVMICPACGLRSVTEFAEWLRRSVA